MNKQKNNPLNKAKVIKNDEFYTLYEDVEKELCYYSSEFENKIIYCNCDGISSNFVKYFINNFNQLRLKKLIATNYITRQTSLFDDTELKKPILITYDGITKSVCNLKSDGSFSSKECIDILKQSDIVITNPPFSLFREFFDLLTKHEKQFLILGNINAIKYRNIFPMFMNNNIWLGYNNAGMKFNVLNQEKLQNVRAIWYTNLKTGKKNCFITLHKKFNPKYYETFDNYINIININKTSEIPINYKGIMAVPISFLIKYNPEQFEILGMDYEIKNSLFRLKNPKWTGRFDNGFINGGYMYSRVLIKHKLNK